MLESEERRAAIVRKLLDLELSAHNELNNIVKLASVICKTPIATITLLDNTTQYIRIKTGTVMGDMPAIDSFCRYTILQEGVMQVNDATQDERFKNTPLVTNDPYVRFYAGAPLVTSSGEVLGGLCVLDVKPGNLSNDQQKALEILSAQVTAVFDTELGLQALKNDVLKLQESELKLKSIFQSSHTSIILIDEQMKVVLFNKAAEEFIRIHNNNRSSISEGALITTLLPAEKKGMVIKNLREALDGNTVHEHLCHTDSKGHEYWWELNFAPVYNLHRQITGVAIDANDITGSIRDKRAILKQNKTLKEITRVQSHEVRHPVVNMMSLVSLLQTPEESENFGRYLVLLEQELDTLDRRIKRIVTIASKMNG